MVEFDVGRVVSDRVGVRCQEGDGNQDGSWILGKGWRSGREWDIRQGMEVRMVVGY